MSQGPGRRHPAHQPPHHHENQPVIIWLTVCTVAHKPLLTRPEIHQHLRQCWTEATRWLVGRYLIMPDHLHLFCAPGEHPITDLKAWLQYWKSLASRSWPYPKEHPLWLRDGWDRQLRQSESYTEKWTYLLNNPVKAGLINHAEDWPYQGELNSLPW